MPDTSPARPRAGRTIPTELTAGRARVLTAALEMFSDQGYAATSMRDLAEQLNLQASSLYSHYRSKDELLHDALAPFLDGLDTLLTLLPHLTLAHLPDWLEQYSQHLQDHPHAVRLAGADLAVARHPAIGERVARQNAHTRQQLTRLTDADDQTAASALGAIWWPILCLPTDTTRPARSADAASSLLRFTA